MNSTSIPIVTPQERLLPIFITAGFLTCLGDFLFWNQVLGVSVAVFALTIGASLLVSPGDYRASQSACIAAFLLVLACIATTLENSFSNVAVLIALLSVLMGERHFREVKGSWARWSESFVAWLSAPGGWLWLVRNMADSSITSAQFHHVTGERAVRSIQILAPAACLVVIFSVILGFGNAVFGELLARAGRESANWILSFDFSPVRALMWIVLATFALALARPHRASEKAHIWTRSLPILRRSDSKVALWQSGAVFVALNALFFVVNTIDVAFLWSHARLPENVSFSQFVHQGVYSLVFAVLLSALVIAAIFQQESVVTSHRILKALGWLWIAQNLVLIAGVFLRLKLYVDAYQLSELRVYVGCFLVLVAVGFVLLALHVARSGSLSTLIWRNAIATFGLFFLVQFPDVAGVVARFNVEQWQNEPGRTLDLAYLEALGPGAWPSICAVAASKEQPFTAARARETVEKLAAWEVERRAESNWRSYQIRHVRHSRRLIEEAQRLQAAH